VRHARISAVAAAIVIGATIWGAGPAASSKAPKATSILCVDRCAGPRATSSGGTVRFRGRSLAGTIEVRFPAPGGTATATPSSVTPRSVEATVPSGAATGKPRLVDASGREVPSPRPLRIVPESGLPAPDSFKLTAAAARPRHAYFDGRPVHLRYSFDSYGPRDLEIELRRHGRVVRRWSEDDQSPFARHSVAWDGLREHGGDAPRGRYSFRITPGGRRAGFRFFDHLFPVRASHSYGDRFGVPRSGGRRHEGQDVWAHCGARLVAARGGKVQLRAYSGSLYGYYVVIDERESGADYMYAHMLPRVKVHDGERARTGQPIGRVGKTGNARGEACQLHFEYWPGGRPQSHPVDPLPLLRRWDHWS
jgi:murein DD-endopeptidase MepM/ murein hydrolase activator NlpD